MALADNIRGERARNRLTQKELATRIKVSENTIRKWESGKNVPCSKVAEMARLFKCTTDYLLDVDNKNNPAA